MAKAARRKIGTVPDGDGTENGPNANLQVPLDRGALKDRDVTNETPVPNPQNETMRVAELGSEMRQLKWISTVGFTVLGTILGIMYTTMRDDDKAVESRATAALEKLDASLGTLTGRVGNLEVGQARIEEQLKFVNMNLKSGFETLSKDLERLYKNKPGPN